MAIKFEDGLGVVYMKVGLHAQESLEDIIRRKQKEYEDAGMIFWGYGGNTCHPTRHVQPFAKAVRKRGKKIFLVMEEITSRSFAEPKAAEAYSDDGFKWNPIPRGIEVRGSRYALVLGRLELERFDINIRELRVAVGLCTGRSAADYLRGHVDKGCFEVAVGSPLEKGTDVHPISLYAQLKEPYAVYLK